MTFMEFFGFSYLICKFVFQIFQVIHITIFLVFFSFVKSTFSYSKQAQNKINVIGIFTTGCILVNTKQTYKKTLTPSGFKKKILQQMLILLSPTSATCECKMVRCLCFVPHSCLHALSLSHTHAHRLTGRVKRSNRAF